MTALGADEVARFWRHIVKGPGERDCWIWVGAIGDDGYGRFWTTRDGRDRVLRPHRIAFSLATAIPLEDLPVVEHLVCDNPICVHAAGDRFDHLAGGTQADNLARMGQRGRGGGTPLVIRDAHTGRAALAARSRALRNAVRDGWDAGRIADALRDVQGASVETTLW